MQLNWHKDDREGRFLLRRIDEVSQIGAMMTTAAAAGDGNQLQNRDSGEFKRKLSKREKKALKKQEKQNKLTKDKDSGKDGESSVAEKLYTGIFIIILHFLQFKYLLRLYLQTFIWSCLVMPVLVF